MKVIKLPTKKFSVLLIVLIAAAVAVTGLSRSSAVGPRGSVSAPVEIELRTPLGEDELLLTSFSGEEEMSRLFRFELEMVSDQPSIDPKDIWSERHVECSPTRGWTAPYKRSG